MELIRFKGPDELKALWVNISASTCAEVAKHDVESPDIHVYVAEAGSDVVGFVKYTFEEKTWGKTCDIASLVVTEPWRSKGIGKKLMAHAEQKARTLRPRWPAFMCWWEMKKAKASMRDLTTFPMPPTTSSLYDSLPGLW